MNYMQVQWGKRFNEDFALGGNFNYSSSEVTNKIDTAELADSSSDSYGIRIGTLYRLTEKLLGGLIVDYSQSPSKTTYYDTFGLGIGDIHVRDTTKQFTMRAGPSYEYRKSSTINMDYQYNSFENDTGKLELHRMFVGIDHRLLDTLFVRGGVALDNSGNTAWTCGLGIYPLKELSIDVGYQYNMFPEIQSEFGRSNLLTISISVLL